MMSLQICKLSFLVLMSISFITAQQNSCQQGTFPENTNLPTKWFGTDCKYLCHCKDNEQCYINGDCPNGCDVGWFGPACQYADMMQDSSLQSDDLVKQTTDNNNETCAFYSLEIGWYTEFFFTWMRIIVGINESNKDVNISFAANSLQIECPSLKKIIIDDKTLDIFCPMDKLIQKISITAPGIKLCSIYVSAGRNIALKQITFQSSTVGVLNSTKAVDGNKGTNWFDHSCIETNGSDTPTTWTVEFPLNVFVVYRFKIYNRNDCCQERLSGFNIDVFNNSKTKVYSFSDQPPTKAGLYMIQPGSKLIISSVTITATQTYLGQTVLNLCEVEIFGDCNQGFYGVDCTMNCSMNCMKGICHVINGTCFDCVPGFYGTYCNTSCPSKCENSVCDRHSGHCKSCSPGFYDINCNAPCPDNCNETGCALLSGNCTSCKDGFQGSHCEEECTGNTYGEKCALNCNIHCNSTFDTTRTCKNTDGSCLHGCISGFFGSTCNSIIRTSPSDSAGEYDRGFAIGVGVGIGVTVAADIIICIVVYFCTKRFKNQPAKKVETTDRNYDRVDSIQQNEHPYYTVDKSGDGYDLVQDVVSVNKKTNSVVTEAGKES